MDPMTKEVSIKRKSHKKVITKSQYDRIIDKNNGMKKITTINPTVEVRQNPVSKTQQKIPQVYNPGAKSSTSLNQINSHTQPKKYLKLVVDELGRKKYQMVSVDESPLNSVKNISVKESSENEIKRNSYKTTTIQSKNSTYSPSIASNRATFTHAPNPEPPMKKRAYNTVYKQTSNYNSESRDQNNNYKIYQGTKNVSYKNYQSNMKKNNDETINYRSYNYIGDSNNSRRYQNNQDIQVDRQVKYQKSPSPIGKKSHPRKSSRKVIVYRNGVKVSEKMYIDE